MNELSERLKNARLSKNLSIQKVSEDTKIRAHILNDIESGNFGVVSDVYMKSFIKSLATYYKIKIDEVNLNPVQQNIQKPSIESLEEKKIDSIKPVTDEVKPKQKSKPIDPALAEYAAQFKKSNIQKKNKVKKVSKTSLTNYIIYSILFVAIVTSIVITVISMLPDDNQNKLNKNESTNNNDTIKIETKKDDLLSYFQNNDSLSLRASANDTAWLRLIIDDTKFIEEMMRPGDNKEWYAYDHFVIDVGNAGAISFFRNGEQLPSFGKPGTVAKNIKVTKDNVISITSIQPKDTNNVVKKPKVRKQKVEEKKDPPPIIESTIQEEDNLLKRR